MGVPLLRLRETLRIERHYDNKTTAAVLALQQHQQRATLGVQLLVLQAVLMVVLLLQMYMCLLSGRD
jgi:hypothetical protein